MTVRLEGTGTLGALGVLRREMEPRRRAAMRRALAILKAEAQARIHSPEGKARRGLRFELRGAGESLQGVLRSRSLAAIFSQRTRGADRKAPPVKAIRSWLRRTEQERSPASAFLVARAIARRGTQGRPVMQVTLDRVREQVLEVFRDMLRSATGKR